MGEHRDNEPELDHNSPIASISFGQERPFVLKHRDARKPGPNKKQIPRGKFILNLHICLSLQNRQCCVVYKTYNVEVSPHK